ncbi:hypothetical protein [Beijerinckia mobilis]|uniref:hypothetical protein n=1 Tax=Beijerinckia mobilis TaxID=231434 RepID=UPI0012EC8F77|nr:hypothetical protein [Beijerinckia mobilis]
MQIIACRSCLTLFSKPRKQVQHAEKTQSSAGSRAIRNVRAKRIKAGPYSSIEVSYQKTVIMNVFQKRFFQKRRVKGRAFHPFTFQYRSAGGLKPAVAAQGPVRVRISDG